jgi:hypothetical protein
MTVVAMTRREFSRLEVVVAIEQGQMSASRAAELLGLSRRQIFRLLDRFRSIGPNGLASRKRGVPSNNQNHRCVRQLAMMLVRQHYVGVGVVYSMTALWSTVAGVAGFLSNSTRGMAMIDKIISSLKSSR